MKTAEIIRALRTPSPKADVDKMIDDDVGPLVERIVTAGAITRVRAAIVDYLHAIYVHAARLVNEAKRLQEVAAMDAAHDRAEATELYRSLQRAYTELDKIRFGQTVDPEAVVSIADELTKYDRPVRYGRDDDED